MQVNKAAHVLSHSVAAGVYTYAVLGNLPGEAVNTAEFVELIDSLFDAFHSCFFHDPKKLKRPLSDKSAHMECFEKSILVLENLTVQKKNVLFIKWWQLSISCVKESWQHLRSEFGLKFLFTSRLNQDVAKNLFATIRRKGGCRDNPSAKEFRCALRMVMVAELVKPAMGANCSPELDNAIKWLLSPGANNMQLYKHMGVTCDHSYFLNNGEKLLETFHNWQDKRHLSTDIGRHPTIIVTKCKLTCCCKTSGVTFEHSYFFIKQWSKFIFVFFFLLLFFPFFPPPLPNSQ